MWATSATKVTLTYKSTDNKTYKIESSASVAPGESVTAFGVSNPGSKWTVLQGTASSMVDTVNGVVVTANQPIVAIANESSSRPER